MPKFLGREELLQKEALKIEKVDLGDESFTYVREMTGKERDQLETLLLTQEIKEDGTILYNVERANYRAKLVVNTACDEAGNLLFKPEDADALGATLGWQKMDLIANAAGILNNFLPHLRSKAKEEHIKNSETGQDADNTSESAAGVDSPTPTVG